MSDQPAANRRCLVGAVVVEDQMHVEPGRHRRIDGAQELAELARAMPPVALADHLAALHVQRREQRGGPVAHVVVGPALHLSRPHRQKRLRPVQRLDLRLLVGAEHQSLVRRVEVEPDDVPDLLDE